jgi:hypothetical protein
MAIPAPSSAKEQRIEKIYFLGILSAGFSKLARLINKAAIRSGQQRPSSSFHRKFPIRNL